MSVTYKAIQWSPYKRRYDLTLLAILLLYIGSFIAIGKLRWRGSHAISDEILLMRALGTCALSLLTFVLCIGPLARSDRRFLPLLYNRRHLGVTTCLLGVAHAVLALGFYHGFGVVAPPVSLLTSSTQYRSLSAFPFEILGAIALLILILMAATSHDFWLKNLSPGVWKSLHMLVYPAWGLLILHVALGAMQSEKSILYPVLLFLSVLAVGMLHLLAGRREVKRDKTNWIKAASVDDIPESRAKIVCLPGRERVAIFKNNGKFSAVANVCAHQAGPLGEGKIIDGCITCPWHGYQYRPHDGCSPPPFTEKIATYRLRIEGTQIFVASDALPPGSPIEPATIKEAVHV